MAITATTTTSTTSCIPSYGVDVGSTSIKVTSSATAASSAALPALSFYKLHMSDTRGEVTRALQAIYDDVEARGCSKFKLCLTGSGSLDVADFLHIRHVQEVIALRNYVLSQHPGVRYVIEVGGEDSKFLDVERNDMRMNSSCGGGTGAFLQFMCASFAIEPSKMDSMASANSDRAPSISSRCGVFAKADATSLLASGRDLGSVCSSIVDAVASQVMECLSGGVNFDGGDTILLGGPSKYYPSLRQAFVRRVKLRCPTAEIRTTEEAHMAVSIGTRLAAEMIEPMDISMLLQWIQLLSTPGPLVTPPLAAPLKCPAASDCTCSVDHNDVTPALPTSPSLQSSSTPSLPGSASPSPALPAPAPAPQAHAAESIEVIGHTDPLFPTEHDFEEFVKSRAGRGTHRRGMIDDAGLPDSPLALGIDAGSTTCKILLVDETTKRPVYHDYEEARGDITGTLSRMTGRMPFELRGRIHHAACCGYGEEMVKALLGIKVSAVETLCHCTAAVHQRPGVRYIVDIGGQDMKFMRMEDDGSRAKNVQLNNSCASGCGSFLQLFAESLGKDIITLCNESATSQSPLDLGTRCTVFMTSLVRHAQARRCPISDIFAGLCISVVKNSLHKVVGDALLEEMKSGHGEIVVQGGLFLNPLVLKAFEVSVGRSATRPDHCECMGAYGAALIAISLEDAASFSMPLVSDIEDAQTSRTVRGCTGCGNKCETSNLSIKVGSKKYNMITGNRCEIGAVVAGGGRTKSPAIDAIPCMLPSSRARVTISSQPSTTVAATTTATISTHQVTVGMPRVLQHHEYEAFWAGFFQSLGWKLVVSPHTRDEMYTAGLSRVPSQSQCWPSKACFGHVDWLINNANADVLFYPAVKSECVRCATTTAKRHGHRECVVVRGMPYVVENSDFKTPTGKVPPPYRTVQLDLNRADRTCKTLLPFVTEFDKTLTPERVQQAIEIGLTALDSSKIAEYEQGEKILEWLAEDSKRRGVVILGRKYLQDEGFLCGTGEWLKRDRGCAVLTVDSLVRAAEKKYAAELKRYTAYTWQTYGYRNLIVAYLVASNPQLYAFHMTAFGCGPESVFRRELRSVFHAQNVGHRLLLVVADGPASTAQCRLRLRTMLEAITAAPTAPTLAGTPDLFHGSTTPLPGSGASCVGDPELGQDELSEQHIAGYEKHDPKGKEVKRYWIIPTLSYRSIVTRFERRMAEYRLGVKVEMMDGEDTMEPARRTVLSDDGVDLCLSLAKMVGMTITTLREKAHHGDGLLIWRAVDACRYSNLYAMLLHTCNTQGFPEMPVMSVGYDSVSIATSAFLNGYLTDVIYWCMRQISPRALNKDDVIRTRDELEEALIDQSPFMTVAKFKEFARMAAKKWRDVPHHQNMTVPLVGVVGSIMKYETFVIGPLSEALEEAGFEVGIYPTMWYILSGLQRLRHINNSWSISTLTYMVEHIEVFLKDLFTEFGFRPVPAMDSLYPLIDGLLPRDFTTAEGWRPLAEMESFVLEPNFVGIVVPLSFNCMTEEHQVLTDRGFMFLHEIEALPTAERQALKVASYNTQSKTIVFETPQAVVVKTHDAQHPASLVEFTAKKEDVSLVVTEDHDMYCQMEDGEAYSKHPAKDLLHSERFRFLACAANGGCVSPRVQDEIPVIMPSQERLQITDNARFLALLELYGFWLGNGSLSADRVIFNQRKADGVAWLQTKLEAVGLVENKDYHLQTECIGITHPGWLASFTAVQPKCFLPAVFNLSALEIQRIILGMWRADGSETSVIRTRSLRFRDDLVRLLLLAGWSPSFTSTHSNAHSWEVTWATLEDTNAVATPSLTKQELKQSTMVMGRTWCMTMPSGFLIARRAHEDKETGTVLNASRPVIIGNCMSGHVSTKAFISWLKKRHIGINVVMAEYDVDASETNRRNRIRMIVSSLRDRISSANIPTMDVTPFLAKKNEVLAKLMVNEALVRPQGWSLTFLDWFLNVDHSYLAVKHFLRPAWGALTCLESAAFWVASKLSTVWGWVPSSIKTATFDKLLAKKHQ